MQPVPRPLPDELRRAVMIDLRPVRPLRAPGLRMLVAAAWVPIGVTLVLTMLGLRHDAAALGWPMICAAGLGEIGVGLALVALALAESVPARGTTRGRAAAALGAGVSALAVQAWLTHAVSRGTVVANPLISSGPACFVLQLLVGLPALAIGAILVGRAQPLRAARSGVLVGAGAGILAEGIYHLHCSISDLRHVLIWHGGAVLALAIAGLVAGLAWERVQERRITARRGSMSGPNSRRS